MNYDGFVDALRSDGAAFVEAARGVDPEAPVPTCGEWTVGDLCAHVGRLHRWAAEVVERRPAPPTDNWKKLDYPQGDALVDFVAQGYVLLADRLATTPENEPCWSWTGGKTVAFWARRQAHELAVHRWDAQNAATPGGAEPVERAMAADGIQELFDILPFRPGGSPTGHGETIHLHCTDGAADGEPGEWLIRLDPDGVSVVNEHAKADAAARGGASDLLLMMWGRIPVDRLEVFGDASLLERWSDGKL